MAVKVKGITNLDALLVRHKGAEYTLVYSVDGFMFLPFAYCMSLKPELKPIEKGDAIPFLRVLRPNQIAPTMVMKMRMNIDGCALNAGGCSDGKTTQSLWLVSQLSPKRTLIVTHRTVLAEQWMKEGKECMGFSPWIADKPEKIPEDARVVVVMIHVLQNLSVEYLRNVDLLIVDECDRVAGPVFGKTLLQCTPKRILGLTATPGEIGSKNIDPVLSLLYGTKPILSGTKKPFKVVQILYPFKPVEKMTTYYKDGKKKTGPDWRLLTNSIAYNHKRNVFLCRFAKALLKKDQSNVVLIQVKLQKHVEYLDYIFKIILEDMNIKPELIYKDNDASCSRLYIGTLSKAEAGIDEKSMKNYEGRRINIVMMGVDVVDSRQAIGRGFRSDMPFIFEFLDDHRYIRDFHAVTREKCYLENGCIGIKKIEAEDIELDDGDIELDIPVPDIKPPVYRNYWNNNYKKRGKK